jgi:hypothetical protein
MVGTMRGTRPAVALPAAVLLASAAPAAARPVEVSGSLAPRGTVTIAWHGDPARGCAAAGLCGYSGSVTIPADDGNYDFTMAGGRLLDGYVFVESYARQPVVRVKRTEAGAEGGACVDTMSGTAIDLNTARAGRNRLRLSLDEEGVSPGRCAGPELTGLLTKLPHRTRTLSRLVAGRARVADFSGDATFSRGRFSGTIHSTLRVGFRKGDAGVYESGPPGGRSRRRRIRVADVHAVYRVVTLEGAISTSFVGLTDPPCADLDACGVSGSSRWAVRSAHGRFAFDATARARRGDRGVRGAVAAVRRGPARVFGDGDLSRSVGTTTADVSRAGGGGACHDRASASSPGVSVYNEPRTRLRFEFAGEDAAPSPTDLLRTGCPGPREEDVLGFGSPAAGSVSMQAFGRQTITTRMRDSGRFERSAYSGTHSSDLTLGLRLVSIHASYRRARGIE